MDPRDRRVREIQENIRRVLLRYWDPIGVQDVPEAQDEYDSYVGGLYRLLVDGSSDEAIVDHLHSIELATMGLPRRDKSELVPVVQRLRDIDVRLDPH